jgi:hypothetical protein
MVNPWFRETQKTLVSQTSNKGFDIVLSVRLDSTTQEIRVQNEISKPDLHCWQDAIKVLFVTLLPNIPSSYDDKFHK